MCVRCDASSLVTVGWNLYILSSVILTLQSQDKVWSKIPEWARRVQPGQGVSVAAPCKDKDTFILKHVTFHRTFPSEPCDQRTISDRFWSLAFETPGQPNDCLVPGVRSERGGHTMVTGYLAITLTKRVVCQLWKPWPWQDIYRISLFNSIRMECQIVSWFAIHKNKDVLINCGFYSGYVIHEWGNGLFQLSHIVTLYSWDSRLLCSQVNV